MSGAFIPRFACARRSVWVLNAFCRNDARGGVPNVRHGPRARVNKGMSRHDT